MENKIVIFGAGRTGRGFIAHLAHRGGYDIVLVDKDHKLVKSLAEAGRYHVHVLADDAPSSTIYPKAVYHVDDNRWLEEMVSARLLACSVFGNNLEELSVSLARGLKYRFLVLPGKKINLVTCENFTGAATYLRNKISEHLDDHEKKWLEEKAGFSESMILSTCLNAGEGQDPLAVRAQNFFDWPCDGDAFKGEIPGIYGLKPLARFGNQLRRKIYTYNCINAVITYLGAQKGYTRLHESAGDQGIARIARKAAAESSEALVAEYGFNREEQNEWVETAFDKFADPLIPDPIARNGADPVRKLGRDDRLTGPALLALKHGIRPEGIMKGIMAGFDFHDTRRNIKVSDLIESRGLDIVLKEVCGLYPEEELYLLLKSACNKQAAGE